MSSRNYNPGPRHPNPETVLIEGSFTGAGAADPVAANNTGRHFSVVRDGAAGKYKITFADKFPHLVKAVTQLQMAAAPAGWVSVIGAYSAANKTLHVHVFDNTGVPAAADLTADDKLHFSVTFQNASSQKVR